MINRYYGDLSRYIKPNHALIIFGPRQVGKTTLLKKFLSQTSLKYRLDSGDSIRIQQLLGSQDFDKILEYAQGYDLIAIDEAQNIPNVGIALKILVDQVPGLSIIATGSSSFDLAQSVGEPLTGRKVTLTLYPVAQLELAQMYNNYDLRSKLGDFLIFGAYPAVVTTEKKEDKIALLMELVDSYLLKDVLAFEKVKRSDTLLSLVKLLAFQIGQLVSHNELATQLRVDAKTVAKYLDLLEKSFVIYKLGGLSGNPTSPSFDKLRTNGRRTGLRNEVVAKHKYYFVDLGIRNAVIAQFNPLEMRSDVGGLWENFVFIERLKKTVYTGFYGSRYFWRTYQGQEVDFVEQIEGKLSGFEAKWSETKKAHAPTDWLENYPQASFNVISPANYFDYVLVESR